MEHRLARKRVSARDGRTVCRRQPAASDVAVVLGTRFPIGRTTATPAGTTDRLTSTRRRALLRLRRAISRA